tara:strand:+ start:2320 stop:3132 length:813 start_codon:yes stop_codon:yes gene_type:complete
MRRTLKMPTPGSIQAGQTATVNIPLGPTYHRFYIEMTATNDVDPAALIPPADWGLYIGDIRLNVNGNTKIEVAAADLVKLNGYHGEATAPGVLVMYLSQPWMRTPEGEDDTSYGTFSGMNSFTMEMDLKPGITVTELKVSAVVTGASPFGPHLVIKRNAGQSSLVGEKEYSDFPRGAYNMMAFHLTTAAIGKVRVEADGVELMEQSKVLRDVHQSVAEKTPQAGMTHIDFLAENRIIESVPMTPQDFRLKLDFSAVDQNFHIYSYSIQGP